MLIQRAGTGTLPPPGFASPPWSELADAWDASVHAPSAPTVTLGPTTITLGHDDCEGDDLEPEVTHRVDGHAFGWDNESPARQVEVGRVRMEWRPVTNEEYLAFWNAGGQAQVDFPPSWVSSDSGIEVRFFSSQLVVIVRCLCEHGNGLGPHAIRSGADARCKALAGTDVVRRVGGVRYIQGWTAPDRT